MASPYGAWEVAEDGKEHNSKDEGVEGVVYAVGENDDDLGDFLDDSALIAAYDRAVSSYRKPGDPPPKRASKTTRAQEMRPPKKSARSPDVAASESVAKAPRGSGSETRSEPKEGPGNEGGRAGAGNATGRPAERRFAREQEEAPQGYGYGYYEAGPAQPYTGAQHGARFGTPYGAGGQYGYGPPYGPPHGPPLPRGQEAAAYGDGYYDDGYYDHGYYEGGYYDGDGYYEAQGYDAPQHYYPPPQRQVPTAPMYTRPRPSAPAASPPNIPRSRGSTGGPAFYDNGVRISARGSAGNRTAPRPRSRRGRTPPSPFPPPPMDIADDVAMSNLLLSWYYAGFYTGQYQARKDGR